MINSPFTLSAKFACGILCCGWPAFPWKLRCRSFLRKTASYRLSLLPGIIDCGDFQIEFMSDLQRVSLSAGREIFREFLFHLFRHSFILFLRAKCLHSFKLTLSSCIKVPLQQQILLLLLNVKCSQDDFSINDFCKTLFVFDESSTILLRKLKIAFVFLFLKNDLELPQTKFKNLIYILPIFPFDEIESLVVCFFYFFIYFWNRTGLLEIIPKFSHFS